MDDKLEALLKENLKISQDNSKILQRLYKAHKLDRFYKFLHFLFTIVIFAAVYYFTAPYIRQAQDLYNQAQSAINEGKAQIDGFQNTFHQ